MKKLYRVKEAAERLFSEILLDVGAKMESLAHEVVGELLSDVGETAGAAVGALLLGASVAHVRENNCYIENCQYRKLAI